MPESRRARGEKVAHFWVGKDPNIPVQDHDPFNHLLCVRQNRTGASYLAGLDTVTIHKEQVTCQECLEWMYA